MDQGSSGKSVGIAVGGCALGGCLVLVMILGWATVYSVSEYNEMIQRAKRSEAPANLEAIRTAELAYHALFDTYTAIPPTYPTIPEQLSHVDPAAEPALIALGWMPDGMVRCRYAVTLVSGGTGEHGDFGATAECDLDGDGSPCLYTASAEEAPWLVTDPDEY